MTKLPSPSSPLSMETGTVINGQHSGCGLSRGKDGSPRERRKEVRGMQPAEDSLHKGRQVAALAVLLRCTAQLTHGQWVERTSRQRTTAMEQHRISKAEVSVINSTEDDGGDRIAVFMEKTVQ